MKAQRPGTQRLLAQAGLVVDGDVRHVQQRQPGAGGVDDEAGARVQQRLPGVGGAELGAQVRPAEAQGCERRVGARDLVRAAQPGGGFDQRAQLPAGRAPQQVPGRPAQQRGIFHLGQHQPALRRQRRRVRQAVQVFQAGGGVRVVHAQADALRRGARGLAGQPGEGRVARRVLRVGADAVLEVEHDARRTGLQGLVEALGPVRGAEEQGGWAVVHAG